MMEEIEIIEKIDKFLEKEELDLQTKFILTKKISEEYWLQLMSEGEEEDLGDEDEDILGENELEDESEDATLDDLDRPPKPPKPVKKQATPQLQDKKRIRFK